MLIRPAREADAAAITEITNHYIATTAIHFAYEPLAVSEILEMWQRYRDRHPWLVAEDEGGDVIGFAKSGVWRDRSAYHWTCEVGLYLSHTVTGRGIGTQLYTQLLDECAARGFHSAVAGITLPNPASIRLHEKLGFVPAGVVRHAGFKLDAWHDVAFFQKMFA